MKTINQNRFNIEFEETNDNFYLYQKSVNCGTDDCIEIEKQGAAELIKVLQEWVNEMA